MECDAELESRLNSSKWYSYAVLEDYTLLSKLSIVDHELHNEDNAEGDLGG
jgi:hypothetical protein